MKKPEAAQHLVDFFFFFFKHRNSAFVLKYFAESGHNLQIPNLSLTLHSSHYQQQPFKTTGCTLLPVLVGWQLQTARVQQNP